MNIQEGLLTQRLLRGLVRRLNNQRIAGMGRQVAKLAPKAKGRPVAFFKASTGIDDLSWNSGFHLLASWALRLQGIPVVYFACGAGMSRCVLGTNREHVHREPPCRSCTYQSRTLYTELPSSPNPASMVHWFTFDRDAELEEDAQESHARRPYGNHLAASALSERSAKSHDLTGKQVPHHADETPKGGLARPLPLGQLCLPGLRWILRRHHLEDDEETRFLLREYILSAWNVAQKFSRFLDETNPRAVVVFNGQFFPEAVARHRGAAARTACHYA